MTPFEFLVASLAVYRMSLLLSEEDGPAWIFRKLRNVPPKKSSLHKGIRCVFCVSVWMASLVTAFLWWIDKVPAQETFLTGMALSGAAIALNQTFTKG
jgi:hypothetical protein